MRRLIAVVSSLIVPCSIGLTGCGPDKKTVEPEKEIALPKHGPIPVTGNPPGKDKPSSAVQRLPAGLRPP